MKLHLESNRASAFRKILTAFLAVQTIALNISPAWAAPAADALPSTADTRASIDGNKMTVVPGGGRQTIEWDSFHIGSDAWVYFQDTAGDVTVNKITGGGQSEIFGQLDASGIIYLLNRSGVLFGEGSHVNVGGLVASTFMDVIEDADGKLVFQNDPGTGDITVEGGATINAGAFAYLVGQNVNLAGSVNAGDVIVVAFGNQKEEDYQDDGGKILVKLHGNTNSASGDITLTTNFTVSASVVTNADTLEVTTVDPNTITLFAVQSISQADGIWQAGAPVSLTAGSGDITLANANEFAGAVSATAAAGGVTLKAANDLLVGDVTAGGNLSATAGGEVAQAYSSTVKVTGTTVLEAGGDVDFQGANNDFGGMVTVTATNGLIYLNDVNDLTVGDLKAQNYVYLYAGTNLTLKGAVEGNKQLSLTAHNGSVKSEGTASLTSGEILYVWAYGENAELVMPETTVGTEGNGYVLLQAPKGSIGQLANTAVTVDGNAVMESAGDIVLNNTGNDFATVAAEGQAVTLTDKNAIELGVEMGGITLENVSATDLTVTALDGDITQTAGKTVVATGATTLTATLGDIVLTNALNDFATVTATAKNVSLADANALTLGDVTASAGNVDVTATSATISGNVQATQAAMFSGPATVESAGKLEASTITLDTGTLTSLGTTTAGTITADTVKVDGGTTTATTIDGALEQGAGHVAAKDGSLTVTGTTTQTGGTMGAASDTISLNGGLQQSAGAEVTALTLTLGADSSVAGTVTATTVDATGKTLTSTGTTTADTITATTLKVDGGTTTATTIDGALEQSAGQVSAKDGSLTVTGTTTQTGGTMGATGDTITLNGALTQGANGTITADKLTLQSDSSVAGTVTVGDLDASGTTLTSTGDVDAATIEADTLKATGGTVDATTSITADVEASGSAHVTTAKLDGTLTQSDESVVDADEVTGKTTLTAGTLTAGTLGELEQNGGTVVAKDDSLEVTGTTTQNGGELGDDNDTITLNGALTQGAAGTITADTLTLKSDSNVAGTVGATTIDATDKTLTSSGQVTATDITAGTLDVDAGKVSAATITGEVDQDGGEIDATTSITGNVDVAGADSKLDTPLVTGDLHQHAGEVGAAEVTGQATVDGGQLTSGKLGSLVQTDGTIVAKENSLTVTGTAEQSGGKMGDENAAIEIGGKLTQTGGETGAATLTLKGGAEQSGDGAKKITATSLVLEGAANDVTLGSAANDFGTVSGEANNLTLVDASGFEFGKLSVNGNLDATAKGGAITQTDDGVTVTGTTTLTAVSEDGTASYDITLASINNDFQSEVKADGASVVLKDGTDGIQLGDVTARTGKVDIETLNGGDLTVLSGKTVKSETGDVALTAAGAATVEGTVSAAQGGASVAANGGAATIAGTVTAATNAAVSATAAATVSGTVEATAENGTASVTGASATVENGATVSATEANGTASVTATGGAATIDGTVTASSNATVSATAAATVSGEVKATAANGTASVTGASATVENGATVSATEADGVASVTATGGAATIDGTVTAASNATVSATAAATITGTVEATAENGTASVTGASATVENGATVSASEANGTASVTATGGAATIAGTVTAASNATVSATTAATVSGEVKATAANGTASVTGASATVENGATVSATEANGTASVTATGGAATIDGTVTAAADATVSATAAATVSGTVEATAANGTASVSGASATVENGATVSAANGTAGVTATNDAATISGTVTGRDAKVISDNGMATVSSTGRIEGSQDAVLKGKGLVTIEGSGVVQATRNAAVVSEEGNVDAKAGSTVTAGNDVVMFAETGTLTLGDGAVVDAGQDMVLKAKGNVDLSTADVHGYNVGIESTDGDIADTKATLVADHTMVLVAGDDVTLKGGPQAENLGIQSKGDITFENLKVKKFAATSTEGNVFVQMVQDTDLAKLKVDGEDITGKVTADRADLAGEEDSTITVSGMTGGNTGALDGIQAKKGNVWIENPDHAVTGTQIAAPKGTVYVKAATLGLDSTQSGGLTAIYAGEVTRGSYAAGGNLDLTVTGNLTAGSLSGANVNLLGVGGNLTAGTVTAGGAVDGTVNGSATVQTLDAGGLVELEIGSAATFADARSGGDFTITTGGELKADNLNVGGNLDANVGGGATLTKASISGDEKLKVSGTLSFDTMSTHGAQIEAGSIHMGKLTAGNATLQSHGTITDNSSLVNVSTLTMTAGGDIGSAGNPINTEVGSRIDRISGRNIYLVEQSSGHNIVLGVIDASGHLSLSAPRIGLPDGIYGFMNGNGGDVNIHAGSGLEMNLGGRFGTADNPMRADVTGEWTILNGELQGTPMSYIYVVMANSDYTDTPEYTGTVAIPGLVIVNGRPILGHPDLLRKIYSALAFSVDTPELKSKQGIFGSPLFLHSDLGLFNGGEETGVDYWNLIQNDLLEPNNGKNANVYGPRRWGLDDSLWDSERMSRSRLYLLEFDPLPAAKEKPADKDAAKATAKPAPAKPEAAKAEAKPAPAPAAAKPAAAKPAAKSAAKPAAKAAPSKPAGEKAK